MAKTIPCPNPTCSHDFNPLELQAAAQLLCPKCGFAMKGSGATPAKATSTQSSIAPSSQKPAPPAKPVAAPSAQPRIAPSTKKSAPPAKPAAAPVAPTPKKPPAPTPVMAMPVPAGTLGTAVMATPVLALPVPANPQAPQAAAIAIGEPTTSTSTSTSYEDSVAEGEFFNPGADASTGTLVKAKATPKKKFNWRRFSINAFAIGIATSLVITAIASIIWFILGSGGLRDIAGNDGTIYWGLIRDPKGGNEKVYKLVLHKDQWTLDSDIMTRFGAHAAYRSNEVDFWFAFIVKDYGVHRPRDADMLRFGIEKLEGHFEDALELAAQSEPVKFKGIDSVKLQFKGQYKKANWLGECYMIFKDGVAFWWIIASPDWANVEGYGADLPGSKVNVIVDRRGWREQPMPTETFASANNKLFVTGPKGVWEKHNAKDEDENGELLLLGRYLKEKDNRKNAHMLFFTMEKKDNLSAALKAAKEYIEAKAKNSDPTVKFTLAVDPPEGQTELGTLETFGNRRARVVDLKMSRGDELKRFFVVGVINEPETGYVFLCECTWENRQIWRSVFMDFLGTLRIKKDEGG